MWSSGETLLLLQRGSWVRLSLVGSGRRRIVAATNGSQRVGGCNPPLMVVLSLCKVDVKWRVDYATYNVEFVAEIAE